MSTVVADIATGRQRWEVTVTDCPGLSGEIFSVDGVLVAHASGAQIRLSSDDATIWDSPGPDPCIGDSIERMVLDGETLYYPIYWGVTEIDSQSGDCHRIIEINGPPMVRDILIAGNRLVVAGEHRIHSVTLASEEPIETVNDDQDDS